MKNWWCLSIQRYDRNFEVWNILHQGGPGMKREWYILIPFIKAILTIPRTSGLDGFWWRIGDVCQSKGVAGILRFRDFLHQGRCLMKHEWYFLIPLIKAILTITRTSGLDGFRWWTDDVCQSSERNFEVSGFCSSRGAFNQAWMVYPDSIHRGDSNNV